MGDHDEQQKKHQKFEKSYFDVLGLCCTSEVPLIENILKSLDGIKEFSVVVPTRTVIVLHDNLLISQLQIVKALNQARLEANVRVKGDTSYQKKWPSPFVIACGVLLALSLLKYVYHPLRWLALAAAAVGVPPLFLKAIASIRNLRFFDVTILVLIAVIATVAMEDFTEAGFIVFLFTIAQWLESRSSHKAKAIMSSLMSITPQKAVIAESGEEVDADEVKLNTVIAVKAGEIIAIDGIIVDGSCDVDEKTLTGESFPVSKQKDSTVWAGTINLNGYISVKTTALAEDCVVAKMAKLVEEAQNSKTKTQRLIDKCSMYYTPAVIIIAVGIAVIPLALGVHNRRKWFRLALVFLVSACPCALILSTPIATFCALTKAAKCGVLIKGGDYLETLAKIKVMAFDKTGTITRGEFVVAEFQSLCEDVSLDTLVYWVASVESKSSHPMAAALVEYGKSLSMEPNPENVTDFQNFPGEGIFGRIDGKKIYIGNRKIGHRAGCSTIPTLDKNSGKTVGYVYSGATPAGIFSLSDACRTGAAEAVRKLKSMSVKTAMLTGDSQAAAMHAQEQLGHALDIVHAELLPEDKAKIIEEFKKEGRTAMIGDGVNDAPALATADIGISMGISGSALATETGHVILMSNDIRKVPEMINLARKARRKVIENVFLAISTKAAILALAFAGHPLVWAAVLADVGTCLLVIFNSMLLLRGIGEGKSHKHIGKCCKSSSSSAATNTKKCDDHGKSSQTHQHNHKHKHCCSPRKVETATKPNPNPHQHKHCCAPPKVETKSHLNSNPNDSVDLEANINPHEHSCHQDSDHHHCNSSHSNPSSDTKEVAQKIIKDDHHCQSNHSHQVSDHHHCNSIHDTEEVDRKIIKDDHHCHSNHGHQVSDHHHCNSVHSSPSKDTEEVAREIIKDDQHCHSNHIHQISDHHHCNSIHSSPSRDTEEVARKIIKDDHHCHSNQGHVIHIQDDSEVTTVESGINHHKHHDHQSGIHDHHRPHDHQSCINHHRPHDHQDMTCNETTKTTRHTHCKSLETREIGGCCKSYMKECCGKHGQFGGGLQEIIME
ncbi:putative inactive cadmium/zinc-transporting ATPase HMA3 [Mercurialis annua]|uniref:putative inactive cadmium/zinc-transporting ATPase HMA3 n=1 Tax=Mercurialis annua TaxID=3986 RepID=UPI00215E2795|nr:putative inactive cadmium/zinc-transporting ATPase HMA3 [Mercurialis annua]